MRKLGKKAFTLIELLVVIAVVGILVLLATPRFTGYTQKAELARIQHDVKVMEQEVGTMFINNDDDFNEWENNSKKFNDLIQEDKLFEKEGFAYEEPIDGPYKVIPERYKDEINTKLKGTFYANSDGKVYYEHVKSLSRILTKPGESEKEPGESEKEPGESEKEPGESEEEPGESDEIDDLIKKHDFIPIATADELNSIRINEERTYGKGTKWVGEYTGGLDKKYVQVANIDPLGYSEEEGWNPIGSYTSSTDKSPFTGSFDGNGHDITGLTINRSTSYVGLFGYTEGATIKNVALKDVNINGGNHVGGLVGEANNSTITNSHSKGSVTGTGSNVGGLVGYARVSTTITNSHSEGEVTGSGNWVGGLVGRANSDTTVSNSYATGEVNGTGSIHVGGLVGQAVNSVIENSYSKGSVTGTGDRVGGLVGEANKSNIENSHSKGEVNGTGNNSVGGLVGRAHSSTNITNSYAKGSVTGTGKEYVGGLVGRAESSTTISNSYAEGPVTGSGNKVGGLVGEADNSNIENSYATGRVTGSGNFVGGLVGYASKVTTITNSYATGSVTGSRTIGGLLGYAWNTTISNSYSTGSVKGEESVGGLVGRAVSGATITNSYAAGPVTGRFFVGGLVSYGSAVSKVKVTNSYWDKDTTRQLSSDGQDDSFGKTTVEMKSQSIYEDWDFTNIWEIQEGVSYPTLTSNPERH